MRHVSIYEKHIIMSSFRISFHSLSMCSWLVGVYHVFTLCLQWVLVTVCVQYIFSCVCTDFWSTFWPILIIHCHSYDTAAFDHEKNWSFIYLFYFFIFLKKHTNKITAWSINGHSSLFMYWMQIFSWAPWIRRYFCNESPFKKLIHLCICLFMNSLYVSFSVQTVITWHPAPL